MEKTYHTNSRAKIMEYLQDNKDRAVTAAAIDEHLKAEGSITNVTTIYRNLDKLEKEGHVIKYASKTGTSFQYVESEHRCDEHLHLKCVNCGKVIHLDCEFMDEISEHVRKDHGFEIQCRNSVIYGICEDCRKAGIRRHV